jgi:hypothetical protein
MLMRCLTPRVLHTPVCVTSTAECKHHSSDISQARFQTSTIGVLHDMDQNISCDKLAMSCGSPQRHQRFQQHRNTFGQITVFLSQHPSPQELPEQQLGLLQQFIWNLYDK